jgi:hypothetical protein
MNNITLYNNIGFKFENETLWATQEEISNAFERDVSTISRHISSIFTEGELEEKSNLQKMQIANSDKPVSFYSLDVIIAVGYRVTSSTKATQFRIWATNILKQYIKDGYVIDEKRLAQNPDKLNELAAKIRALRNNEKNVYQAVRDCFKISATDYDSKKTEEIQAFYSLLQDKFHYAITEMTAAKIKMDRADHTQRNMGVQFFDGEIPTLTEAQIGKNYVLKDELYRMHLLSEQFLLHAESVALRNKRYTMKELHNKLDEYIKINEYPVWDGYKTQLKDEAIEHVKNEYTLYEKIQKLKYSGIDVDLELFYNGGYDDIYKERELDKKRLSTMYKKHLEIEHKKEDIKKIVEQKDSPTSAQFIKNIEKDNVELNENNEFEKNIKKVIKHKKNV